MVNHPEMVQLSYTQSKIIANAIAPIIREQKSHQNVARLFGVKDYIIQKLATPKAKARFSREVFEVVVTRLGVNTKGWDVR